MGGWFFVSCIYPALVSLYYIGWLHRVWVIKVVLFCQNAFLLDDFTCALFFILY